ncbi:phosphoribosylformylglycinamidine synthase subunit PurS, partial [Candidatus Woesearchaeota archaeon]|nr:phosphoribosylformylglycinamidine synthase subunit PurS [Candidatus Woesearchaeota archaeon]
IEMIVSLKVPDTTAITALQTLQKIGFNKINNVKREDYYKFLIEVDIEKFKNQICKVDILVNVNKHFFEFSIQKNADVKVLVKNINDDGSGILATLKNRLEFKNIKKVEKAVLWSLNMGSDEKEAKMIAEKAAKELLVNQNYQEYEILGD